MVPSYHSLQHKHRAVKVELMVTLFLLVFHLFLSKVIIGTKLFLFFYIYISNIFSKALSIFKTVSYTTLVDFHIQTVYFFLIFKVFSTFYHNDAQRSERHNTPVSDNRNMSVSHTTSFAYGCHKQHNSDNNTTNYVRYTNK